MRRDKFTMLFVATLLSLPALLTGQQRPAPAPVGVPEAWRAEAAQMLAALVKIDSSNPPGNETRVANFIKSLLDKDGIPSEIFESAPGRGNLVARLKGNGTKRPLLLVAHLDVVGVERAQWSVDPFAATIRDGYLYGRGAMDDKAMLSANLEIFLQLHRQKVPLDRDVILVAEAGEEGTPQFGINFLIEHHWDKIEGEFALNEGGSFRLAGGKLEYAGVGTAEKVPRGIRLIARGTSGHGSIPRPDNAIAHLAVAVAKVTAWQPPVRLNETTREYFSRLAKISSPEDAYLYTHLEDAAVQEKLRTDTRQLFQYAVLRTTINPTMIQGGFRNNVIPAEAQADFDVRALPDENMDQLMDTLRKLINDPAVEVRSNGYGDLRPTAPPSSIQTDMFNALQRAQAKVFPEGVTLPLMPTGATDSGQLRAKGVQAYGLAVPATPEDALLAHGNDERMSLEMLGKFVDFLNAAVLDVAAGRR